MKKEDIEKIVFFSGNRNNLCKPEEDKTDYQLMFELHKHEILLQAQIKLIEKGWSFTISNPCVWLENKLHDDIYIYKQDYNNDILSTLASAILWAIDKEQA